MRINNPRGFTLVELVLAVGLIGIISAITIPNLECLKKTAEDTEAKTELASALSAEKMHFAQFDTYTGCLRQSGYRPRPDRKFTIGISQKAVLSGQPKCGRPTDPKWNSVEFTEPQRKFSTLNCNTWGGRAANICNTADAPINSPDNTSDINFASNTTDSGMIQVSYTNLTAVSRTCTDAYGNTTDIEGKVLRHGCWGMATNWGVHIAAFRGRTYKGVTHLSGYWIMGNGQYVSIDAHETIQ
jgi:prepilin-type N-terminal cleavage/methylation domain-containing protein